MAKLMGGRGRQAGYTVVDSKERLVNAPDPVVSGNTSSIAKHFREFQKESTTTKTVVVRILRAQGIVTNYAIYPKDGSGVSATSIKVDVEDKRLNIGFEGGTCGGVLLIGVQVIELRVMETANKDGFLLSLRPARDPSAKPSLFWCDEEFSIYDEPYSRGPKFHQVLRGIGLDNMNYIVACANLMLELRRIYTNSSLVRR